MDLRPHIDGMPRGIVLVLLLAGLALGGCGSGLGPLASNDVTPVVLKLEDGPVELAPWAYCLENTCVDGSPPDPLHVVRHGDEVQFTFGRDDWTFTATFSEHGRTCPRRIVVPVEETGDQEFVLHPAGLAGDWDVEVFGRGDGDAIVSFRWHTDADGQMPEAASGTVGILADHDGELDSYGVELAVTDLAERPKHAAATITVTSADGRTATIQPRQRRDCWAEGSIAFSASRATGLAATRIGDGPFTYTVDLTLDGRTYVGTAEWPRDEDPDIAPSVPLAWEPALPTYAGRTR